MANTLQILYHLLAHIIFQTCKKMEKNNSLTAQKRIWNICTDIYSHINSVCTSSSMNRYVLLILFLKLIYWSQAKSLREPWESTLLQPAILLWFTCTENWWGFTTEIEFSSILGCLATAISSWVEEHQGNQSSYTHFKHTQCFFKSHELPVLHVGRIKCQCAKCREGHPSFFPFSIKNRP